MTTPIELGWRPIKIAPIFSIGQDWIVVLRPVAGTTSPVYPTGTTVAARIYADSDRETLLGPPMEMWPGVIVGDDVVFHVEAAETDLIDKGRYMRIGIVYPGTPTSDPFTWAKGKVVRDD